MPTTFRNAREWQIAVARRGREVGRETLVIHQRLLILLTLGSAVELRGRIVRLGGVVQRTPVDTGRARSSWNIAFGAPDGTVPPEGDETYNWQGNQSELFAMARRASGTVAYLTSGVFYMRYLEHGLYPPSPVRGTWDPKLKRFVIRSRGGFSKQAPDGILNPTLRALRESMHGSGLGRWT